MEKPFSFQARDEQQQAWKEAMAAAAKDPRRFQRPFHAKPIPNTVKTEKFKFMQVGSVPGYQYDFIPTVQLRQSLGTMLAVWRVPVPCLALPKFGLLRWSHACWGSCIMRVQLELEAKRAGARARAEEARLRARYKVEEDTKHRQSTADRCGLNT
jgi:hypothetical protein